MAHGLTGQGGFTDSGLAALDAAMTRHVDSGAVPGLVALVARGEQVHVTVAGQATAGTGPPMRRDSIFRIASMTKPIVGVAAMLLISDGAMALSDPVDRWLPELAGRRVLRSLESPLSDTVPAERAITVEDVLSFRLGFGTIMTTGDYPIAAAEASLGLKTLGPPWPPCRLTPDEWIAGLGSLPLLDQPGERFRYNTGATVAGILIERVAGRPLAEVLARRVFEPLGMTDTGFFVPAAKLDRFTSMYTPGGSREAGTDHLTLVDSPDGWYAAPPVLPDGCAMLVSTVDDLWAFSRMLAGALAGRAGARAGQPGEQAGRGVGLPPDAAAAMLRDRTTPRDKAESPWFFGGQDAARPSGWGLMMAVPARAGSAGAGPAGTAPAASQVADGRPGGYGWDGGSGTAWRTDPATGLTGILLTQRMLTSPAAPPATRDFWKAAYAALALRLGGAGLVPAGHQRAMRQVRGTDLLAAVTAGRDRVQVVPAGVDEGRRRCRHGPPVTPGPQGRQDRAQVIARPGQRVLVTRRVVAVLPPLDHARCLERPEAGGEPVPGRAGVAGDLVEPAVAEADLPDGEQRPLLADQAERRRHRARPPRKIPPGQLVK